jgi:hypothetical protein
MAGRRNQGHLAALHLLRERAYGQDEAIRAWQESVDAVTAADAEIDQLRVRYEAAFAALRAKRDEEARRSERLLGAAAILIGDCKETARLLDVPAGRVARARAIEHGARLVRPGPSAPSEPE